MTPDVDGIIEGCPRCGGPLNVREHDLKPELCSLYVKSGPGPKGYRRPLLAFCENEVLMTCPACSYWVSFPIC
jgi:hypothetical protein